VSRALTALRKTQTLGVRGPYGTAWPIGDALGRDVVVVAGGLGLAPLRPAMYRLLAARGDLRRLSLLVGARTPRDLLFAPEVARWRARFDMDVRVTVDQAPSPWGGEVGVVTKLLARIAFDPGRTLALVCGPEVMMRFAAAALEDLGVSGDAIWLSMERNMKCAVGVCGRCQFGPAFVCRQGPVFRYSTIAPLLRIREV
jgi:NAD(P)H-flavin reductase